MNAVAKIKPDTEIVPADPLALLRAPFPAHQISKLPKPYKKDSPKGKCQECGGYHGLPAVHLDYVGHAALTDRLLDADDHWSWEPMGFAPDGTPAFDRNGGLWIKLTVCGVTRLGYGNAEGKSGGDAVKEIIGDALRNAAMRFGAALDLWHKGDLHAAAEARGDEMPPPSEPIAGEVNTMPARKTPAQAKRDGDYQPLLDKIHSFTTPEDLEAWGKDWVQHTATLPFQWLEAMHDKYLMHLEALKEAAGFPGDRAQGVAGSDREMAAAVQ